MDSIISYKNVCKSYQNKNVLKNIDLDIEYGEFISIIGTSGCGKTTLMKMINGLVVPNDGEVLIHQQPVSSQNLQQLRRNIGYVIQGNGLFPHMTIAQNIGYVCHLEKMNPQQINEIVDKMLQLVNLACDVKNKYPHQLSGGQQQRVGIARAFANNPEVLLMDEPFGALDAITRYNLQNDLKKIHQQTGCTIVFITHDIAEALKLSDRILVLDKGEIQQLGTPHEIKTSPKNEFVKKLVGMM